MRKTRERFRPLNPKKKKTRGDMLSNALQGREERERDMAEGLGAGGEKR